MKEILTPAERNEWIKEVEDISIAVDKISPETIHKIERAETADEKANAIHAAITEAIEARTANKTK